MSKSRRGGKPRRLLGVSQRRVVVQPPAGAPDDQPVLLLREEGRISGCRVWVQDVYRDRVALGTERVSRFSLGLLVHWKNYVWRVRSIEPETEQGNSLVVLEAWGRSFVDSPKLLRYVS